MYIRCPKCGRRGQLPDRWIPEAHTLRCRRCRAMFKTPELARMSADVGVGPGFDSVSKVAREDQPSAFMTDGYFSGFDDPLLSPREPGPGDSNYELTFTLQDAEGDPDSDWDSDTAEFVGEAPSSDEIPAPTPAAAISGLDPWPQRFIEAWGLRLIVSAMILIGALVPTIAYLVWRTIRSGPNLDVPTPTLIAGFACALALLMIAVPLILLAASLTQLVRDLRRLSQQADRQGFVGRR